MTSSDLRPMLPVEPKMLTARLATMPCLALHEIDGAATVRRGAAAGASHVPDASSRVSGSVPSVDSSLSEDGLELGAR